MNYHIDVTRICFVSLPLYGYFNQNVYDRAAGGGAKRQIYLLCQELKQEFDLCAVVGDYGQPRLEERDGVTLHRAYTPGAGSAPRRFFKLFTAMKRANADLYIYRGHPHKAAFVYAISDLLGSKWVYNVSNDSNLGYNYTDCSTPVRWLFRRGLEDAATIISQTTYQRDRLEEQFDAASAVVPNGYPPVSHDPGNEREYFLWIGRIERRQKRPHLFLDCAAEIPNRQFVIIGPQSDEEHARRIEERCASLSNVRYVGPVQPHAIHEYYAEAIALVNTSAHEGFPNTFLEAWRYGTPVTCLDINPSRYLDENIDVGFADGSPEELVANLRQLADDPGYRAETGRKVQTEFERKYAIDAVARQYAAALRG